MCLFISTLDCFYRLELLEYKTRSLGRLGRHHFVKGQVFKSYEHELIWTWLFRMIMRECAEPTEVISICTKIKVSQSNVNSSSSQSKRLILFLCSRRFMTKMLSEINNFLTTFPDSLERCQCVSVCESNADSGFLFHHFISYHLKSSRKVFLLSFCQSFTHFNTVGNKLGSNLNEERKNKNFVFIEGLKQVGPPINSDQNDKNEWKDVVDGDGKFCVKKLFEIIKTIINADETVKPVFMIDNLSVLTDIGVSAKDLLGFLRYLNNYIGRTKNGCLIVGVNNDYGEEDEDGSLLWKQLQYMSDMKVEVRGLESGYCRDVHGQIKVEWSSSNVREKPTTKEAQFKLTDKNCSLFASGLSSAVL